MPLNFDDIWNDTICKVSLAPKTGSKTKVYYGGHL